MFCRFSTADELIIVPHRMTDIMTIAAFDGYPHLMATGNAVSIIAGVRLISPLPYMNR